MKKISLTILAVLMVSTLIVGCNTGTGNDYGDTNYSLTVDHLPLELAGGETKTVTAKLINAKGEVVTSKVDSSKFKWEIISGEDLINIASNGVTCEVKGIKKGVMARIKVSHPEAQGEGLEFSVKVTSDSSGNTGDETTTDTEFLSTYFYCGTEWLFGTSLHLNLTDKNTKTVKIVFEDTNGKEVEVDTSKIKWGFLDSMGYTLETSEYAEITPNGNTCLIKGLKKGEFKITVSHPKIKIGISNSFWVTVE